jgi:hypothetical protein
VKPAATSIDQLRPMLAMDAPVKAFTDPTWLYEIKFDGYRTLAGFGGGAGVQLRTKRGADCTRWYPEVAELLASLPGGPHVIDAEACVLDDIGRSDFNRLQERARRRCWYKDCDQVTLCAFDLLVHDGRSIMDLPLVQRKARLAMMLAKVPKQVAAARGRLLGRRGAIQPGGDGAAARGLRRQAQRQPLRAGPAIARLAQDQAPGLARGARVAQHLNAVHQRKKNPRQAPHEAVTDGDSKKPDLPARPSLHKREETATNSVPGPRGPMIRMSRCTKARSRTGSPPGTCPCPAAAA